MLYYSKSTNGFYDDAISSQRPSDAVPITEAQHRALMEAQSAGQTIASDAAGRPVAIAAAPTLDQLRAAKVTELRKACRDLLLGGFPSSALGAVHTYPSTPTDQQNLSDAAHAAVASPALENPLWCAARSGWAFIPHSALQVEQVHADWLAFRIVQQRKLLVLQGNANEAATAEALAAITW